MGTLQRPTIDPQLRLITRRTLRRAYVPSPAFVKGYQMPARHWQCGRLRGQASDKPRGRKPRAGVARTVGRAGAMGIWEPRAIGCDVAVVTGRWGPLRDKFLAESGGAMNEGRTLHVFRAITLVSRHAVADPPSTGTARDALMKAAQGEACMRRWVRRALMRTNATRLLCRCRQPPASITLLLAAKAIFATRAGQGCDPGLETAGNLANAR